jgi:transposase
MAEPTTRKIFKYKLQPTPAQATQLEAIVRACRELYNAALQERRDAWKMRQVSVNYYQQKAARLLQRAHQKVARQRRDFHHKTALSLVQQYDTVYYEALQVASMVQNIISPSPSRTRDGVNFAPSLFSKLRMLGNKP